MEFLYTGKISPKSIDMLIQNFDSFFDTKFCDTKSSFDSFSMKISMIKMIDFGEGLQLRDLSVFMKCKFACTGLAPPLRAPKIEN